MALTKLQHIDSKVLQPDDYVKSKENQLLVNLKFMILKLENF